LKSKLAQKHLRSRTISLLNPITSGISYYEDGFTTLFAKGVACQQFRSFLSGLNRENAQTQ